MKLYGYFRSSAAYRVRIALGLKGLAYETEFLHLRRREHRASAYLELNPQGLVPALEHDGAVLPQSLAIIEYLDEIAPEPPLLPRAPQARALVRSMALLVAAEMHPLCNLRVLNYLREVLRQDNAAVDTWYQHWMKEGFEALEPMLAKHSGDGRHCYGHAISLADLCLVPQVYNAQRFGCDLEPYPCVRSIAAALAQEPVFAAAAPERQPDAE